MPRLVMLSPRSPLRTTPDDEAAGAPLTSWYTQGVTDGFGDRLLMFDNAATGPVELLRVRPDFAVVPGFESALRARFEQLSSFTHPGFAQARVVNHLENGGGLTVASTHVTGTRLSELFVTTRPTPGMHPASVRDAFGDLVGAIAELHRQGRGVAHGALGAERVLLTFERQLVVTDYVFGAALQQLNLTQEQLWTEFGLVSDAASGATQLDQRGDLAQLGLLMMSLVLGRRVSLGEYPNKIPALLRDFSTVSDRRAPDVTAPLRSWLEQALDTTGFRSAEEAERALVIRPRRPHSINLQAALPSRVALPRVVSTEAGSHPRPAPAAPVAVPPSTPAAAEPVTPSAPKVASPSLAAAQLTPVVVQAPVIASPSPIAAPASVTAAPAPIASPKLDAAPPQAAPPLAPLIAGPETVGQSAQLVQQTPTPAAQPVPREPFAPPTVAPQPIAAAPLKAVAPAPLESPASPFAEPAVTPLLAPESPQAATLLPVDPSVSPIATPPPPAAPPMPQVAAEPPADVVPYDDLVFLAPLDLPPSRFLNLQPTPTVEPRVQFVRLHTPASPPIVTPPPIVQAPRANAPLLRPEPFSWIAEANPVAPVDDPIVASVPRSTPLLRWVAAALGILVLAQGAIIGRLLSRQSQPAPSKEQVVGTMGEIAPNDRPSGVTPSPETSPDAQNRLAQAVSRVPATLNDVPSAAAARTPDQPSAAESTTGTQRADARERLGGIRIVSPIPLQVMFGDKFLGSSQLGPVFTTPGTHELDFINNPLGFRVRQRVLVTANKVVPLRISPPNGSLSVTAQPWAQVWIDGRPAGDTPLDASVSLGEHEVIFKNPQLGVSRQKVVVQVGSPARVSASFIP